VASTNLVEKLKLKIKPHPHPYHIQWLNQGKGFGSLLAVCLFSPLERVIWMSYGVMPFPWMLVMFCWEVLGNLTARLLMMVYKTPTPFTKMAERSLLPH